MDVTQIRELFVDGSLGLIDFLEKVVLFLFASVTLLFVHIEAQRGEHTSDICNLLVQSCLLNGRFLDLQNVFLDHGYVEIDQLFQFEGLLLQREGLRNNGHRLDNFGDLFPMVWL